MTIQGALTVLRQLLCSHYGSQTDVSEWRHDPDVGRTRTVTVTCRDCDKILSETNELEGAPWA